MFGLDLHHHYLTDAMTGRVQAALPGVGVDLDAARGGVGGWFEGEDPDFYVAISE